jgi:hypothetical protein
VASRSKPQVTAPTRRCFSTATARDSNGFRDGTALAAHSRHKRSRSGSPALVENALVERFDVALGQRAYQVDGTNFSRFVVFKARRLVTAPLARQVSSRTSPCASPWPLEQLHLAAFVRVFKTGCPRCGSRQAVAAIRRTRQLRRFGVRGRGRGRGRGLGLPGAFPLQAVDAFGRISPASHSRRRPARLRTLANRMAERESGATMGVGPCVDGRPASDILHGSPQKRNEACTGRASKIKLWTGRRSWPALRPSPERGATAGRLRAWGLG